MKHHTQNQPDQEQARGEASDAEGHMPDVPSGKQHAVARGQVEFSAYDFFQAIATGKQPAPSFEDGYRTELVADALLESGESGTWARVRS